MDADPNIHPGPLVHTPDNQGIVASIATDSEASNVPSIATDSAASTVFGPNIFTEITCAAGSLRTVDSRLADGIDSYIPITVSIAED